MNGKYLSFEDLLTHFPAIEVRRWDAAFLEMLYQKGLVYGYLCPKTKTLHYSVDAVCKLLAFRP